MKKIAQLTGPILVLFLFFRCSNELSSSYKNYPTKPANQHVIVIGVDGMSPIGIERAHTPAMDSLQKMGAYTYTAQAVLPTKSSPNWMSMITGATVEQHGVTSNSWQPDKQTIVPECVNAKGTFLSIFSLLRQEKPMAHLACFYDWKGFGRIFDNQVLNTVRHYDNAARNARKATAYFQEKRPYFLFIHLDHVDHALHFWGFDSGAYAKAIEKTDALIGQLVKTLQQQNLWEQTTLIISADHGGKGRNHGGNSLQEVQIPLIITGQQIRSNHAIQGNVYIYDIAPTIAHIFGVPIPDCWTGKPVLEAFLE